MLRAIHYGFSQSLNVSAQKAFEWCTDYRAEDMVLMRQANATRGIERVSDDAIILSDTFNIEGKAIVKQKLICLYPDRLTWISTHIAGPNKHSQFLYEIVPQKDWQCCLNFTGLHLDHGINEDAEKMEAERLAKELKKMDSEIWRLLAKEMEKELQKN
jgi:hypothetical protein